MADLEPADILAELRRLYDEKVAASAASTEAASKHKAQEQVALDMFKRTRNDSMRPTGVGYTFTAVTDAEKGRITDRKVYYRWALEREPSVTELVEAVLEAQRDGTTLSSGDILEWAIDAILNLSILKVTEQQRVLNAQVKKAHDDEQELPPGLDFDPVPYVSVTKA